MVVFSQLMLKATIFCYKAMEVINKLTRLDIWLLKLRWPHGKVGKEIFLYITVDTVISKKQKVNYG